MVQTKWVAGKTVERIETQRIKTRDGPNPEYNTEFIRIIFTDGSAINFVALESDVEPYVHANYERLVK